MGIGLREGRLGVREERRKIEGAQGRCEGRRAGGAREGQRETLAVSWVCVYLREGGWRRATVGDLKCH